MLRARLFGSPRFFAGDSRELVTTGRPGVALLLGYLLLFRDAPPHRDRVAADLWPGADVRARRANLRRHLDALRRELARLGLDGLVESDGAVLGVDAGQVESVDVERFRLLARHSGGWELAAVLYAGDVFAGRQGAWLEALRAELRGVQLATLDRLAARERERGDRVAALRWLRAAQTMEPLREATLRAIVELRAGSGDAAGALAELRRFERDLWAAQERRPEPATEQLANALMGERRRDGRRYGNLPAERGAFVGRETERAGLAACLEPGAFVTLVGPPGVGKTRLAVRVAVELLERSVATRAFDEALFVDVRAARDDADVAHALARALDVRPGGDDGERVRARLAGARVLLVLDNCEGAAAYACTLADACRAVSASAAVLATARSALGHAAETVVRLRPLDSHGAGRTLLLERTREAAGRDVEIARDVAGALCERLSGLPLALELAARQLAIGSPQRLLARLDAGLTLAPLDRAIGSSLASLGTEDAAGVAGLSVVAGAFDAAAAAAVTGRDVGSAQALLARLAEASLVEPVDDNRVTMLAAIRSHAARGLTPGDAGAARLRLAAHVLERVGRMSPEELLPVAEREGADLTAALETAFASAALAPQAVTACERLGPAWTALGRWEEAERWGIRAAGTDALSPRDRARGLRQASVFARLRREPRRALALAVEAVSRLRSADDPAALARALLTEANARIVLDELETARQTLVDAASVAAHAGDASLDLVLVLGRGQLELVDGAVEAAAALYERAATAALASGDVFNHAIAVDNLAMCALVNGDLERAEALAREGLAEGRRARRPRGAAWSLHRLVAVGARRDAPAEALAAFIASDALARDVGDHLVRVRNLEEAAGLLARGGDPLAAARLLGAADAARQRLAAPRHRVERADAAAREAAVRAHLAGGAASHEADGAALSLDDAAREAERALAGLEGTAVPPAFPGFSTPA